MKGAGVEPEVLRLPELGRLRLGAKGARGQPVSLERWRLTSRDRGLLEAIAARVGGEVQPWDDQFELRTPLAELDVVVPPGEILTAWWELWGASGCQRRCDGQRATVAAADALVETDCVCLAEGLVPGAEGACQLVTRLTVLVPDWPGLGGWRLETGSVVAWREMTAQLRLLRALAATADGFVPAVLAIEERVAKRPGTGTRRFRIPVLRTRTSLRELRGADPVIPAPHALAPTSSSASASTSSSSPSTSPSPSTSTSPSPSPSPSSSPSTPSSSSPSPGPDAGPGDGARQRPSTSPVARSLAIACREAGATDEEAHGLCELASGGRTRSRKELSVAEAERVIGWLRDGSWRGRLAAAPLRARARAVRDAAPGLGDSLEAWFRERFAGRPYWDLDDAELGEFADKIAAMEALVSEMEAEEAAG